MTGAERLGIFRIRRELAEALRVRVLIGGREPEIKQGSYYIQYATAGALLTVIVNGESI